MVATGAIHHWVGAPGQLVSWDPSPATLAKAAQAPVSAVPASYQQAQHLRSYRNYRARGMQAARLMIPAWDMAGRCDIRAMTHVINAYLRRHDTFHSWFEYREDGEIIRRTFDNPRDIKLVATRHGEVAAVDWRERALATQDPLRWNCFSFGIIQRADHFTFYLALDHLHADAMFLAALFVEIQMMYEVLVGGGAPLQLPEAGSYHDYCVRQHEHLAGLTWESPDVRAWTEFARDNDGTLPRFALPLGDAEAAGTRVMQTLQLMDEGQTLRFESACEAAGIRFSGGVFAAAAVAEHRLTGAPTYHVVTPTTTRKTPADFMTTGWFTGLVPLTIPAADLGFFDIARAAQESFDSRIGLADVPFERVLELAGPESGLCEPPAGVPMLSFLDAAAPPLSPAIIAQWNALNGRIFGDTGAGHQVGIWVNRLGDDTTVTVGFPDNPVARESVQRYVETMKAVYRDVADAGVPEPGRSPGDRIVLSA